MREGGLMKQRVTKKTKPYVCVVCGKKKKTSKKGKCCGKNMLSEDKGIGAM